MIEKTQAAEDPGKLAKGPLTGDGWRRVSVIHVCLRAVWCEADRLHLSRSLLCSL